MPDMRVAVHVHEAGTAARRQREPYPDEHAAVASDHHGCFSRIECLAHSIAEPTSVLDDRVLVADVAERPRSVIVDAATGKNDARIPPSGRHQSVHQASLAKGGPFDNGSAYKSHAWRDACAELGITPKKSRPYRPQTNGKVITTITTDPIRELLSFTDAQDTIPDDTGRGLRLKRERPCDEHECVRLLIGAGAEAT
ncbi:hypothetical protein GCM10025867_19390 [Frondihabitans sucicola]|uniref:Integrase catalytic domain-containing protein n=1 Tax=Frondihabitans sucicola TaxID=1268041 RepID=A0ABN6Y125_9MICO|nr:hypothetical protein GCM10025867_19390 [Frondihabitans sucicola]